MRLWMEKVKKIFFLPPLPSLLIAVPSFAVVIFVLAAGIQNVLITNISYVMASYALVVTVIWAVKALRFLCPQIRTQIAGIPFVKGILAHPLYGKYIKTAFFRVKISLLGGSVISFLYAGMKLFAGIYYRSAWLVLLGIYYILLMVMRVFLLAFARGEKEAGRNQPLEWRKYFQCGVMLLFMNQTLAGIVIYAVHQNKSFDYPGALIYMMALYSFYAVIMSVRNVVKVRKYASPVMAAARVVNTTAAIVSMYSLETAMLSRPGEDMAFRRALLSATGGWVCLIVLGMAVYMIIRSHHKKIHGKLYKALHSRYFWVAFGIVMELLMMLAVFLLAFRYLVPITVLGILFQAGVLLYVVNKDEIPEFKIPWLIILLVLPVMGAFIYMLLTSTEQSKKEYRRFEDAHKSLQPFLEQPENEMGKIKEADADAWAQAEYLDHAAGMPCQRADITYYPIGEEFHQALLESLQEAEKFIFMEYFIISQGRMWDSIHEILKDKAAQGLTVCLMYDDFGCMTTLPEQYYKKMQAEGIRCIPSNRFRMVLSRIHNNRDHRKITVIDGKVGYTGGINLADEYINSTVKYGHWKDTAVKIEGEAVRNLTVLFLELWNMQSEEALDGERYLHKDCPAYHGEGMAIPFGDGPEPFYQDMAGRNVYLNMIHTARNYLYITTPYLICDHELMNALKLAAEKGVDVRLVTPHIPDKKLVFLMTRSSYAPLIKSGVKIYEYTPGFVHAKNMVCDDKFAVCGTINLDYRSLVHHFECAAWIYSRECVMDMKTDFMDTLSKSEQITAKSAGLKSWQRLMAQAMKIFAPLL